MYGMVIMRKQSWYHQDTFKMILNSDQKLDTISLIFLFQSQLKSFRVTCTFGDLVLFQQEGPHFDSWPRPSQETCLFSNVWMVLLQMLHDFVLDSVEQLCVT